MRKTGKTTLRNLQLPRPGGQAKALRNRRAGAGSKVGRLMEPGAGMKGPSKKGIMSMKPKRRKKTA